MITIPTRGPGDLGRVFLLAELAVAVAGWGLAINPFDQPNVQQAKDATKRVLDGYEASASCRRSRTPRTRSCARCCSTARRRTTSRSWPTCSPRPSSTRPPRELRAAIRERTKATTTFGYGPRFLHSTGQFHKGGPQDRPLPAARSRRAERRRDPRRAVHLHHAQERAGDRRPEHAARERAARRAGKAAGRRPSGRVARPHRNPQGVKVDADRFRRAGQDGREHGSPHPPRLRSRGRRVRLRREGRKAGGQERRLRRKLARKTSSSSCRRRGSCGSWSRRARPRRRPSTSSPSCSTAATRSSTAATPSGPTTSAARAN